jgi:hypothetical protein
MKPVKIKYWGLFWLSKRGYLLFNGIGWLVAIGFCLIGVALNRLPPPRTLWHPDPVWGVANAFWWVILICLALQLIDAGLAWMKFAKREEEQEDLEEWLASADDEPPRVVEPSEAIRAKRTNVRRPRDS